MEIYTQYKRRVYSVSLMTSVISTYFTTEVVFLKTVIFTVIFNEVHD